MEISGNLPGLNRRAFMRGVALASISAAAGVAQPGARGSGEAVLRYLETLARPGGGYGWGDQERAHLTPTFAVIGCYHALNCIPPGVCLSAGTSACLAGS
jgi:hypothetical protein